MASRAEPTLGIRPGRPGRAERGAQRPARLARAPRRPRDPDLRLPAPPGPPVELPPGERRGAGAGGALLGPRRESPAGARVRRAEVRVLRPDGTVIERGRPLETVARYLGRYRAARDPELPPVHRRLPRLPRLRRGAPVGAAAGSPARRSRLPVFRLALMDTVVAFDHRRHTMRIVANAFLDEDGGAEAADGARPRADRPGPRAAPGAAPRRAAGGGDRRSRPGRTGRRRPTAPPSSAPRSTSEPATSTRSSSRSGSRRRCRGSTPSPSIAPSAS